MGGVCGKGKVGFRGQKGGMQYMSKNMSSHSDLLSTKAKKGLEEAKRLQRKAKKAVPKTKAHKECLEHYGDAFVDLGLDEFDVWMLYQRFVTMNYEKLADPITTADDTFDVARIERTPFTFRCFLDPVIHEGHGSFRPHQDLNFRQWVVCVWGYCSLSEPSLVRMAFSTYDTDQNGKLTPDELERFTKELFGHGLSYAVPTKLLEFLGKRLGDMRENGTPMPLEEFVEVAKKNTALLLPAYNMQLLLQRSFGGEKFWKEKTHMRHSDPLYEDTLEPKSWKAITKRIIRGVSGPIMPEEQRRARGQRRRSSLVKPEDIARMRGASHPLQIAQMLPDMAATLGVDAAAAGAGGADASGADGSDDSQAMNGGNKLSRKKSRRSSTAGAAAMLSSKPSRRKQRLSTASKAEDNPYGDSSDSDADKGGPAPSVGMGHRKSTSQLLKAKNNDKKQAKLDVLALEAAEGEEELSDAQKRLLKAKTAMDLRRHSVAMPGSVTAITAESLAQVNASGPVGKRRSIASQRDARRAADRHGTSRSHGKRSAQSRRSDVRNAVHKLKADHKLGKKYANGRAHRRSAAT